MPPATLDTPLLFDNDVFTHWRNGHDYVKRHVAAYFSYHKQYPALPSITAFEALKGFKRDSAGLLEPAQQDNFDRLQNLIQTLDEVTFDTRAAQIAAEIFLSLKKQVGEKRIRNDLFIAATALANGLGVATRNRDDFERIESLVPTTRAPLYIAVWR